MIRRLSASWVAAKARMLLPGFPVHPLRWIESLNQKAPSSVKAPAELLCREALEFLLQQRDKMHKALQSFGWLQWAGDGVRTRRGLVPGVV